MRRASLRRSRSGYHRARGHRRRAGQEPHRRASADPRRPSSTAGPFPCPCLYPCLARRLRPPPLDGHAGPSRAGWVPGRCLRRRRWRERARRPPMSARASGGVRLVLAAGSRPASGGRLSMANMFKTKRRAASARLARTRWRLEGGGAWLGRTASEEGLLPGRERVELLKVRVKHRYPSDRS
jgi:hypothetical protein